MAEKIKSRFLARLDELTWTIPDFVERTGIARSTVYSWFEDPPRLPQKKFRSVITRHLGVDIFGPDLESVEAGQNRAFAPRGGDGLEFESWADRQKVDAVELDVLSLIPADLSGDQFLAEIRRRRYGRFAVNVEGQGLFAVRLPADLGEVKAGERVVISPNVQPLPLEIVCVKARGKHWLAEYNITDGGKPVVALWPAGGVTENFELLGTAVEHYGSMLKRPR